MTEDGTQRFLARAADHRLLTAAEERRLGHLSRAGDRRARNELVECNIRLVVSVARYYRNRGVPMDDVIQNGIVGLNRAAEKYDPARETRFSTYATLWIKQAIQRGLSRECSAIHVPSNVAGVRAKVRQALTRHPDADPEFLADLLDLEVEDVERALGAAEVVTSLDRAIVSDDHEHTLLDTVADPTSDDAYSRVLDADSAALRRALDALEREFDPPFGGSAYRRVLEMNFGVGADRPMPVREIAREMGRSVNTVKTMRAAGLAFLAERMVN